MPLLGALLALAGRFAGKLLTMAFGWASLMLFGRVPRSKQVLLAGVAFGSLVWATAVIGTLVPPVGDFITSSLPLPAWIGDGWRRAAMVSIAAALPLLLGLGGLYLTDEGERPRGPVAIAGQILRGYPYAAALSLTLLVLSVVAPIRRIQGLARGWEETHVPMLVHPGGYDRVADDLEAALDASDLEIERSRAPWFVEAPSKILALTGGTSVRGLVPDRLLVLRRPSLEVTIHPTDVAIAGRRDEVARARAAIATRLPFTSAYLTATQEAQRIEDRLVAVAAGPPSEAALGLREIDRRLATEVVPEDEWEILYRERLQVERDVKRDRDKAAVRPDIDARRPATASWFSRLLQALRR
jgi:hypothetical protein